MPYFIPGLCHSREYTTTNARQRKKEKLRILQIRPYKWVFHITLEHNPHTAQTSTQRHNNCTILIRTCGTLKNPHCSMDMSAEHRSKFAALQRQWWRLHMSETFSSGTINSKQTNKQTNKHTKKESSAPPYGTCSVTHKELGTAITQWMLLHRKRINKQKIYIVVAIRKSLWMQWWIPKTR